MWYSRSSAVAMPAARSAVARCGPTPLTNCTGAARSMDRLEDKTGGERGRTGSGGKQETGYEGTGGQPGAREVTEAKDWRTGGPADRVTTFGKETGIDDGQYRVNSSLERPSPPPIGSASSRTGGERARGCSRRWDLLRWLWPS